MRLRGFVALRKNTPVVDVGSADIFGFIQHFCDERLVRERHSCSSKQQPGPDRTARLHRSAPEVIWCGGVYRYRESSPKCPRGREVSVALRLEIDPGDSVSPANRKRIASMA